MEKEYFSKTVFERYIILDQILKRGGTYEQILETLKQKHDIIISKRTLQSDFEYLKNCNLNIVEVSKKPKIFKYDTNEKGLFKNGYDEFIRKEYNMVLQLLGNFVNILEIDIVNAFMEFLKKEFQVDYKEKSIITMQDNFSSGQKYLLELFSAIYSKKVLKIIYKPFNKKEQTYFKDLHPYQLKLYNSRWYLICFDNDKSKFTMNLALDRIVSVECIEQTFKPKASTINQYKDVIGVTLIEGAQKTRVVLKFTESFYPYIKTKKIHSSQKEIAPQTISITVLPNNELYAKILSFGSHVELIEPPVLRKELKNRIELMSQLYK
ncbi:helix-turn-helix transcriptional regulator [Myroides profundi]|uniref:WYL domain-containing protein n=1 Tax=Myroides profundi TaxID=480520 RepID=A0AAJ5BE47_MYRPR|nr:WYL domain-containing protein [Myroides profundi]AJH14538.1 hypothetical protein MPR_1356 [Myroides profundi]SEQ93333.1 WYL domain-containing protein [Myroides profundi]